MAYQDFLIATTLVRSDTVRLILWGSGVGRVNEAAACRAGMVTEARALGQFHTRAEVVVFQKRISILHGTPCQVFKAVREPSSGIMQVLRASTIDAESAGERTPRSPGICPAPDIGLLPLVSGSSRRDRFQVLQTYRSETPFPPDGMTETLQMRSR